MVSVALSGPVVTADGLPVTGVTVFFLEGPVALPDIAQLTGPDGQFSLSAPVFGQYRIAVNAPGCAPHEQEVRVSDTDDRPWIEIRVGQREDPGS